MPPLQIPVSETGNRQRAPAVDDDDPASSTTSAGGKTLPSANNNRPFTPPFLGCSATITPSSSAAASPNLLSTSRNSPREAGLAPPPSRHRLHHLRLLRSATEEAARFLLFLVFLLGFPPFAEAVTVEEAAAGWRCWDGALKVMAGNVTPIRVPNVVLLSWKKDPVDCITTA